MSSLVWWGVQQITRHTVSYAAANPAETSLAFVLLANPSTRGFTLDVLRSVGWRTLQMSGRLTMDIGRAAVTRSSTAATVSRWSGNVARFLARHPVATVAATYVTLGATSIALAQDEDPLTQEVQTKATSQGIGGTGQPSLGSFPILGSGFRLG